MSKTKHDSCEVAEVAEYGLELYSATSAVYTQPPHAILSHLSGQGGGGDTAKHDSYEVYFCFALPTTPPFIDDMQRSPLSAAGCRLQLQERQP